MSNLSAEAAATFITAGKATFTVRSLKSGAHFTFRADKAKDRDIYFVSILSGSDYVYVGTLFENGFSLTAKSRFTENADCVVALRFVLTCIFGRKTIPAGLEVKHDGACGRCGRQLTHPESLDTGLGPECAKKAA